MNKIIASLVIAMGSGALCAQPIVDIGVLPNMDDTTLEIYVRPHEDFGDVVSGLSFTLRWPVALGQDFLGTRVLTCPSGLPISPTAIVEDTGYYSRTFNGFGTSLLVDEGCPWSACEEEMIMYLPAASTNGLDQFEIVPDLYFISLGGIDYTGVVPPWGPCATAIEDTWANAQHEGVMAFPVPADNEIFLQSDRSGAQTLRLIAFSMDGRPFELASLGGGRWEVTGLPPGSYVVRVGGTTGRFVKL
jgi:hypothetical protein